MLFFYGVRTTPVLTAPLPDLACAHCQTPNGLSCTVFSRYVHFFWIPVFPIGKDSVTECAHCKQTLLAREMPASYRAPVQAVQQQAGTPLTHFALVLLLGAFVAFGMVMSLFGKSDKSTATAPVSAQETTAGSAVAGTRYKINMTDDGRVYSLAQVTKVTPDSVFYRLTDGLHGPVSDAGATLALRDSVAPANANQRLSTQQWQYSTTGQGAFKRFD